jgi:hypothetical protein
MKINIRFTFTVGNTTHAIYNEYRARQTERVTLDTTFSVVTSVLFTLTTELRWISQVFIIIIF